MGVWNNLKSFGRILWTYRQTLILVLTPLVFLPIPFTYTTKAGRCLYGVCIMGVYWCTEVVPLAVTALLPIMLFPWLGVLDSKQLCANYFKDTNFLFFSGLLIAVAVEHCNLHRRIALKVLCWVGSQPKWLMFGFMVVTAFLSMWLSNTATTAMLMPIAYACLSPDKIALDSVSVSTVSASTEVLTTTRLQDVATGLKLSIAFAANIGGTGTLTGTGPNLIVKDIVDGLYGDAHGLNFGTWFAFGFPNMILALLAAWLWLQLLFLGPQAVITFRRKKTRADEAAERIIKNEYRELGPIRFGEILVIVLFLIQAILWFFREPAFIKGWSSLSFLEDGYVTDACVGMTIAVLVFFLPSLRPFHGCSTGGAGSSEPAPPLLEWDVVHQKMSWGVLILLGGSFAMSDAVRVSGLSEDISETFSSLGVFPPWGIALLLSTITVAVTNIASNTATATIFLPIAAEVAEDMHVHPLYFMLPVTISASLAFMLPVATPPNAIVFAYGDTSILDMIKAGFLLNIVCILILQISINSYARPIFGLSKFPSWAGHGTDTTTETTVLSHHVTFLNETSCFCNPVL